MPATSVVGTGGMAGLAISSTAEASSRTATTQQGSRTIPRFHALMTLLWCGKQMDAERPGRNHGGQVQATIRVFEGAGF